MFALSSVLKCLAGDKVCRLLGGLLGGLLEERVDRELDVVLICLDSDVLLLGLEGGLGALPTSVPLLHEFIILLNIFLEGLGSVTILLASATSPLLMVVVLGPGQTTDDLVELLVGGVNSITRNLVSRNSELHLPVDL